MCQLFGLNCASPTNFGRSLRCFCQRGGLTDIHSHGFGICIYEGNGIRSFHDTSPAADSPIAEMVQTNPIQTNNMLAHIRYATQGSVCMENVHPFSRELWDTQWTFAHNGEVPKYSKALRKEQSHAPLPPFLGITRAQDVCYMPVGDTDSEAVFCAILNALKAEFSDHFPSLPVLQKTLQRLCDEIIEGQEDSTIFNFLLGCGPRTLFAYSWPGRRPGSKVWNGLYYLVQQASTCTLDDAVQQADPESATFQNRVALIATKPVTTDEQWREFQPGQLILFENGQPDFFAEQRDLSLKRMSMPLLQNPIEVLRQKVSISLVPTTRVVPSVASQ